MVQDMVQQLSMPDVVNHNTGIGASEQSIEWELAIGLLREMPWHALTVDVTSYNAATSACEKGKQWKAALRLLQELLD